MIYLNESQRQNAVENIDRLILTLQMAFCALDDDTFYKHPVSHEDVVCTIQKELADIGAPVRRRSEMSGERTMSRPMRAGLDAVEQMGSGGGYNA